jgi:GTP pyrophosphokinase
MIDARVVLAELATTEGTAHVLKSPRVADAFALAQRAYGDDRHWTGISLMDHALGTLRLLLTLEPDEDTVVACLLRYVPATTRATLVDVEDRFGGSVRAMVASSHLLVELGARPRRFSIDALRLMMLRLCDDHRALLIFLCGRTVALDSLSLLPVADRKRVARDALRLYSPLAASTGVYALKHLIETKAFPVAYPDDAERIAAQQQEVHERFGGFLPAATASLAETLRTQGVACRVEAREKQPFSIFTKMNSKGVSRLTAVHDLFALRVIVQKEEECYLVLGLLHRIAHPIPNRFKDYIAFPKPNGYQSLHTTLKGLPGSPPEMFTEVQIRTEKMHAEAQFGIAAHWNYKKGGTAEHALQRFHLQKAANAQQPFGGGEPFVDHIFVLTPKGDVVELPEGATPLDFAFQVHTDIGLAFRAARVNGSIVPLTHVLENGDVVDIIKSSQPQPSPRWLKLLKTASARSRLKRYLQERKQHLGIAESPPMPPPSLPRSRPAKRIAAKTRLSQFRAVGTGVDVPLPLKSAQCCKPERHRSDSVLGVITRDGVIRVHRASCKLTRGVNPERRVKVEWM